LNFFLETHKFYDHIYQLMVLSQKSVIIAAGILVTGVITATITTLAVTKVLNLAAAQIQSPFMGQSRLQQQQPAATAAPTSTSAGSFGPSCTGCVTTQNLANGAVTNPKLADSAVTTNKIAPGAVSISAIPVLSAIQYAQPNSAVIAVASCPSSSVVTGGGFQNQQTGPPVIVSFSQRFGPNGWAVEVFNPTSEPQQVQAEAICTTIHP
jgi:hypothetical protein